jgi:hypothetical protein
MATLALYFWSCCAAVMLANVQVWRSRLGRLVTAHRVNPERAVFLSCSADGPSEWLPVLGGGRVMHVEMGIRVFDSSMTPVRFTTRAVPTQRYSRRMA